MKKWYTSKTIWINIVIGMVGVIELYSGSLQQFLSPQVYGTGMVIVGFIGVVLRAVTTSSIGGNNGTDTTSTN